MQALFCLLLITTDVHTQAALPQQEEQNLLTKDKAILDKQAHLIGKNLRCPVCQGMPISESPSPMAQAMMQKIRLQLEEGLSQQQIEDYFVQRYGEWVLLRPTMAGFNGWLWLLPPCLLVLAALCVLWQVRRWRQKAPKEAINDLTAKSTLGSVVSEDDLEQLRRYLYDTSALRK